MSYAELVVVNDGVLFWESGCESWCVILSHWLPVLGQLWMVICWASFESWLCCGCYLLCVMPSGCESWCVHVVVNHSVFQWLWIMVCYAEPVVMYHGVLCWASCFASWCVILGQWLWMMVCHVELVAVNAWASVLCWVSGCESWCAMLSQLLWIWCVILSQYLWIIMSYAEPVVVNHGVLWWASWWES